MLKRKFTLGCDVGSSTIVCSVLETPEKMILEPKEFANNFAGFEQCISWLKASDLKANNVLVCMEHTGVYSESFCYYLYGQKIKVVIESGAKIKKSFKLATHKTDEIDSIAIAEYAIRYADHLIAWEPRQSAVESVKSLLSSRELFVKHRTAQKNALSAYKRKVVQNELIREEYEKSIQGLNQTIKNLENEIESILKQNEHWIAVIKIIKTVKGVDKLLPYNMFVISNAFSMKLDYKKLAAYLRICPYQYKSGTSIKKKAKSPKYGPAIMRKLLFLAAKDACQYDEYFRAYYARKDSEGKCYFVIMNNVGNKLLKIICAMINSGKPYIPNYRSVNPILVK
jgi:transposase